MISNYLNVIGKYSDFETRATRTEYWLFQLVNIFIFIIGIVAAVTLGSPLQGMVLIMLAVFFIGIILPSLAVTVRRLHDSGKSGWWVLVSLIPTVGSLILLVLCVLDSAPGSNEYGPNPKNPNQETDHGQSTENETIEVEEV